MHVELVAVERRLWSGEASFVLARTTVGDIGVLPGHEPTLAQMEEAGVVRIDATDGTRLTVAVHGGFANEIDVSRAKSALDRADESDPEGVAAAKRAQARLRAAGAAE